MLGSLQEFLPECVTEPSALTHLALNSEKQPNWKTDQGLTPQKTLNNHSHSHLNRIRFVDKAISSQLNIINGPVEGIEGSSSNKNRNYSDRIKNNNVESKPNSKDYVAEDKSFLLAHYQKLQKHRELPHREHNGPGSIKKIGSISMPNQQKRPSYMHLKGKLKENHHLLKSLVQVEQMQQANPRSFFEISFQEMCEQFQKIKLQRRIRKELGQYSSVDKPVKFPLNAIPKRSIEMQKQEINQITTKSGRTSPSRRLLQQNQDKWISTRTKSLELGSDRSISKAFSLQRKQNEMKRRTIINKIDKLLDRTPKERKYSTKSNRHNSFNRTVSKFK